MRISLARRGATIDAIYYCPHDFSDFCNCRKPAPGMLLEAARAHKIDLTSSWMIGDSDHDVEAGKNAGCKTVRLLDPNETPEELKRRGPRRNDADLVVTSLAEAARQVLHPEGAAIGSSHGEPRGHLNLTVTAQRSDSKKSRSKDQRQLSILKIIAREDRKPIA